MCVCEGGGELRNPVLLATWRGHVSPFFFAELLCGPKSAERSTIRMESIYIHASQCHDVT